MRLPWMALLLTLLTAPLHTVAADFEPEAASLPAPRSAESAPGATGPGNQALTVPHISAATGPVTDPPTDPANGQASGPVAGPVTGLAAAPSTEPAVPVTPERLIYRTRASRTAAAEPSAGQSGSAAGSPGSTMSWWGHLRAVAALAGVVSLIVMLAWGYRVTVQGGPTALGFRGRQPGLIQLISRQTLAPRQSLCLVRVGPRMVLLGLTPTSVQTLDVLDDPDLVARLAGQAATTQSGSATRSFHHLLDQEESAYGAAVSEAGVSQPADGPERAGGDRIAAIVAQLASARRTLRTRSA